MDMDTTLYACRILTLDDIILVRTLVGNGAPPRDRIVFPLQVTGREEKETRAGTTLYSIVPMNVKYIPTVAGIEWHTSGRENLEYQGGMTWHMKPLQLYTYIKLA